MKLRAFIAVDISPEVRTQLAQLIRDLDALGADMRTVSAESVHLTLKFLGDIDQETVSSFKQVLEAAARKVQPLQLRFEGLGAFPNLRTPKVIWAGVGGDLSNLTVLFEEVEAGCCRLGVAAENRVFRPHLTLARVRGKKRLKALCDYIKINALNTILGSCAVSGIHLFQSQLRPQGAVHTKLVSCQLGSS